MKPSKMTLFEKDLNILQCAFAYNKYGGYCIPISSIHRPAVQEIINKKVYEPDTIDFLLSNCQKGDIVHAGTFFGDFLPAISAGISENALIWAFEPNNENYRCSEITILINSLKNVHLFNAGLGELKSTKKMLIKTEDGISLGGASKIINEKEKGNCVNVEIISLDQIIPIDRNISIIQLDVEGYELEAIKGAVKTILRCKPILILEDNNNIISSKWFSKNILSLGYEIVGFAHNNIIMAIINNNYLP